MKNRNKVYVHATKGLEAGVGLVGRWGDFVPGSTDYAGPEGKCIGLHSLRRLWRHNMESSTDQVSIAYGEKCKMHDGRRLCSYSPR